MATRVDSIGEIGNIAAEPGTKEWATAVRIEMQYQFHRAESNVQGLRHWIELFDQHAGYKVLSDRNGKPFATFAAFCQAPEPYGLGYPSEVIERIKAEQRDIAIAEIVKTVKPLSKHGEIGNGRRVDNIKSTAGGTGAEYLLARLKRDAPEIAAAVERGEYKSARAAGIAAGIVKVKSPEEVAIAAVRKCRDKVSVAAALIESCTAAQLVKIRKMLRETR